MSLGKTLSASDDCMLNPLFLQDGNYDFRFARTIETVGDEYGRAWEDILVEVR